MILQTKENIIYIVKHEKTINNDTTTTVASLQKKVTQFIEERGWQQLNTPKNLSMHLAIEASKIMELFVWSDTQESMQILTKQRAEVEDALAAVAFNFLEFCGRYNIDLTRALERKIVLNAEKYPVSK